MQKIEIALKKRQAKFVIFIGGAFFTAMLLFAAFGGMIKNGFVWYQALFGLLFLVAAFMIAKGLWEYLSNSSMTMVAESDRQKAKFYLVDAKGKAFNTSEEIELSEYQRFYPVVKTTRLLLKEKSFEFEPKSGIFKTEIDVFPSLWEASDEDIQKVLMFIKTVAPEIELGYENIWQKITKK